MPSKKNKCISAYEICEKCDKKLYLGELIYTHCRKIICADCKIYFNYHYCGIKGSSPGKQINII